MIRKTTGYHIDPVKGKKVNEYIIIGYAAIKTEGLQMLADYNRNPYDTKAAHRNKPSKLDKHYDLIKQKLPIRGANVRAVYEFILSERDPNIGTYSNFNKYIKSKGLKPVKTVAGHPRFETAPGIQDQVDWKENVSIANRFGEIFTFQVFDYKLGNSRYTHFTYKLYKTRQDVFDCLIASFKATGGVPREILFDNMSSIVDRDGERKNISNQVRAFAKDFNFKINEIINDKESLCYVKNQV